MRAFLYAQFYALVYWWPSVAIGICLAVLLSLIGGYL